MATKVYDFPLRLLSGEPADWDDYRGKVLVIANTASKCGFTPQYADLQKLYERYRERGFSILGFPCNQFGEQEPGGPAEVQQFCTAHYGVSFPLFEKTNVRGPDAHPLFRFLTAEAPFEGLDQSDAGGKMLHGFLQSKLPEYLEGDDVKWNFTKFLIDREGKVVRRFEPYVGPMDMEPAIQALL